MSHPHASHHDHSDAAEQPEFQSRPRHQNEMNSRAPVSAPEAEVANEARAEIKAPETQLVANAESPLVPTEKPILKVPPQSVVSEVANENGVKAPLVVEEEVRQRAEKLLAAYIGERIEPALTDGLVLNLKEHVNGEHGGIELCFESPRLNVNGKTLGDEVKKALQEHPTFAPLFHDAKTTPHFMKPTEPGKENMLHVQVNHLTAEQYSSIMHALSVPIVQPEHEKVMQHATGTAVSAQKKDTPSTPEVPSNTIQKPVAALDKGIAQDNELAPQGVAL